MKEFLLNWNYKKHIIAELLFYGSIGVIGNSVLGKKSWGKLDKEKLKCPVKTCRQMTKKQKCFNCALLGCLAIDMTASYFLLKCIKKKLNS